MVLHDSFIIVRIFSIGVVIHDSLSALIVGKGEVILIFNRVKIVSDGLFPPDSVSVYYAGIFFHLKMYHITDGL